MSNVINRVNLITQPSVFGQFDSDVLVPTQFLLDLPQVGTRPLSSASASRVAFVFRVSLAISDEPVHHLDNSLAFCVC